MGAVYQYFTLCPAHSEAAIGNICSAVTYLGKQSYIEALCVDETVKVAFKIFAVILLYKASQLSDLVREVRVIPKIAATVSRKYSHRAAVVWI